MSRKGDERRQPSPGRAVQARRSRQDVGGTISINVSCRDVDLPKKRLPRDRGHRPRSGVARRSAVDDEASLARHDEIGNAVEAHVSRRRGQVVPGEKGGQVRSGRSGDDGSIALAGQELDHHEVAGAILIKIAGHPEGPLLRAGDRPVPLVESRAVSSGQDAHVPGLIHDYVVGRVPRGHENVVSTISVHVCERKNLVSPRVVSERD
jgi:hypothetical protein